MEKSAGVRERSEKDGKSKGEKKGACTLATGLLMGGFHPPPAAAAAALVLFCKSLFSSRAVIEAGKLEKG